MCGITGFFRLPNAKLLGSSQDLESTLRRMNAALVHRGPDQDGFLLDDPAWLAMRRLKIIDLATGQQPIFNEDREISIVYNGEVYNYLELRQELESKGHRFQTHSDTEVLVHLYEEEGPDFAKKLRGMFAFAIWDRRQGRLLLGRDPLGIKPLYWGIFEGWLLFGSEIKALYPFKAFRPQVDPRAVDDHLTLMFIPTPLTIYQGLQKLDPGSILIIDRQGTIKNEFFWRGLPLESKNQDLTDESTAIAQVEEKISECVRMSLRSDVPLGVFLSGGIDSSAIAYFAKKHKSDLKTYTVSFDEKSYDEGEQAAAIARHLGTQHTDIRMEFPEDLPEFAQRVLNCFDEPFGDISALPTYLLCERVREHCVVSLSGDGGDELFGGYPTFQASVWFRYYQRLPDFLRRVCIPWAAQRLPVNLNRVTWDYKVKRFASQGAFFDDYRKIHFAWRGAFDWAQRRDFYEGSFWEKVKDRAPFDSVAGHFSNLKDFSIWDQLFYIDRRTYLLDQFLVKSDRMSMAHSLEVRPSMLDHELAELSHRLSPSLKIRGFSNKVILRRLLEGKIPANILNLPKRGFTPPLSLWLTQKKFEDFVRSNINSSAMVQSGVLAPGLADRLFKEHRERVGDHTRRLWVLLGLALFYERHQKHFQN